MDEGNVTSKCRIVGIKVKTSATVKAGDFTGLRAWLRRAEGIVRLTGLSTTRSDFA